MYGSRYYISRNIQNTFNHETFITSTYIENLSRREEIKYYTCKLLHTYYSTMGKVKKNKGKGRTTYIHMKTPQ